MVNILKFSKRLALKLLPKTVKKTIKKFVLYWLRNKTFKPYLKKKNIEGVVFDFWICDRDGRDWYDLQCTDPEWVEMRFIRDHMVSKDEVVLVDRS